MRSRAQIKGHPVHPALIPFPLAFLTGALFFDVIGVSTGRPSMWATAAHLQLAGLIAGVVAAVPGAIDYVYSVPPRSSGKRRATVHALGNSSALLLFGFAWWIRDGLQPGIPTLAFESLGAAILAYSGYLGGTLVTRNMISVDHRYANAGTWQEADFTAPPGGPLVVGRPGDLQPGQMKLLRINGHRIVLARTNEGFTAFEDRCTHRGGSLAAGVLIGATVQCLWHGSQFDAHTGRVSCGPAKEGIGVYEVQEKDGQVWLASVPG